MKTMKHTIISECKFHIPTMLLQVPSNVDFPGKATVNPTLCYSMRLLSLLTCTACVAQAAASNTILAIPRLCDPDTVAWSSRR